MTDRLMDLVEGLERLEDELGSLLREGRLFPYARTIARFVAWLRRQPRNRVLLLTPLAAGVVAGLLILATTSHSPVEEVSETGSPDRDWDWSA